MIEIIDPEMENNLRVLVTGVGGQLGHDVMNELADRGLEGIGTDLAPSYAGVQDGSAVTQMPYVSLDITDPEAVRDTIENLRPDAVIHCAAWTAVDAAEEPENRDKVFLVNAQGTRFIAQACAQTGAKMLYLSTDYVFDGTGSAPWTPDCKDFSPLNVYGQSKLEGENAVRSLLERYFIVRIAWVFGLNGRNFIRTMLDVGKKHPQLRVVSDQIGTPTYTYDLARLLVDMILTDQYGCYHATNEGGFISWYDFAVEIFRQAAAMGHPEYGTDRIQVTPVTTAEYGISKAARPFNSRLDKSKLAAEGFTPLPDWRDALSRYLKEIGL